MEDTLLLRLLPDWMDNTVGQMHCWRQTFIDLGEMSNVDFTAKSNHPENVLLSQNSSLD